MLGRVLKQGLFLMCAMFLLVSSAEAKDVLTVASPYDPKTLDPHMTNDVGSHLAMRQIYEKLVAFDENQNVIPCLAEKWEVSEDGKTYTFHLKKGVKFHNGEEMKASDVLFSFKRMLSPEAAAIHAYSSVIDPEGLKALDDYTVVVRTKEPLGAFLASMNHGFASIVSEKAVTAAGKDYGMNPVGTGAFKFVSWTKGDKLTLERFADYHGKAPVLSSLILRAVTEATSRTIELESGAVDVALDLPGADIVRLEENPKVTIVRRPSQLIAHMGFNLEKAPYDNIKVRQAMNLAVNRPGIVKVVYRGQATAAKGPWADSVKYAPKDAPEIKMDIKKAKELLKEAGYENGFKAILWINDSKEQSDLATILQENYKKIGIDLEIKVYEWGAYIEALKKPDHELYILSWSGGAPAPDPYFFAGPKFHSSVVGSSNRSRLKDPKVDELIDKGAVLQDGPEREAVYRELYFKLNEVLPWVVLSNKNQMYGMAKNVKGINFSSSSINYFGSAYFE